MSRCFPFPPPGYDKKARVEDIDLLKKEKSREKKVNKEKKDKEKRESKEKRHKDRSDEEKRKEKKEKKERDREKKKKDRDKNKTSTSDEQRLLGKTDDHNGGNLLHKEHQANDVTSSLKKPDTGQSAGYTGAKLIQNDHPAKEAKRSELLLDSGKSIKDKEMEKSSAAQSKREDRMVRLVATASSTSMEVLDSVKSRKVDDRKIGGLGIGEESRYSTTAMVQKPAATVGNSTGAEAVSKHPLEKKDSKPLEKKVDGRKEAKDKIKEGEGSEKRKEKHKDKDREKKVKSKDKEREKERKKEEKAKEKVEEKRGEMKESKESNREKITGSHCTTASQLRENGSASANLEGSFRKRKDIETNGFLHTDDMRPIKFQKLSSSTHPISGNGKMLEPCQTALDRQGTSSSLTLNSKERKINGVIEAQPSASSDSVKATAIRQVDQKTPRPPKPPHPDCRYLSQIYAVPKVEELCDFGDQEWLFNSSDSQERKPKSSEVPQFSHWDDTMAKAEEARLASRDGYASSPLIGVQLLLQPSALSQTPHDTTCDTETER